MSSKLDIDSSSLSLFQGEQLHPVGTTPQCIIAILPAYDEEVSIGSMVLLTKLCTDQVIVVDGGSSDRTADIARRAGAEVIVHKVNTRKGGALRTGFSAAIERGADIIVTIDSDAQYNPADIPKLVAPILKGEADMVNGCRYFNGHEKNTPAYYRVGQTVLDTATNPNSDLKINDSQSGFRAFSASTVDIFRFNAQGMAIESEMLADAGKAGLRIMEVEIGVRNDAGGSMLNPIKHGFHVLLSILIDMGFKRPLFYFTLPGMFLDIVGFYMGAFSLRTFTDGGSLRFGPTMLMVLMIVIGSFLVLAGILLHTLAVLLRNTKVN